MKDLEDDRYSVIKEEAEEGPTKDENMRRFSLPIKLDYRGYRFVYN